MLPLLARTLLSRLAWLLLSRLTLAHVRRVTLVGGHLLLGRTRAHHRIHPWRLLLRRDGPIRTGTVHRRRAHWLLVRRGHDGVDGLPRLTRVGTGVGLLAHMWRRLVRRVVVLSRRRRL